MTSFMDYHRWHNGICMSCLASWQDWPERERATPTCSRARRDTIDTHLGVNVLLLWHDRDHPRHSIGHFRREEWLWAAEWLEEMVVCHWQDAKRGPGAMHRPPLSLAHEAVGAMLRHLRANSEGRVREMLVCLNPKAVVWEGGSVAIVLAWWTRPWASVGAMSRDAGKEPWLKREPRGDLADEMGLRTRLPDIDVDERVRIPYITMDAGSVELDRMEADIRAAMMKPGRTLVWDSLPDVGVKEPSPSAREEHTMATDGSWCIKCLVHADHLAPTCPGRPEE